MKRILVSALVLALLTVGFAGCGYEQIDVPKELKIDAGSLSEDADNLMPIDDTTPLLTAIPEKGLYIYYTDRTIESGVLVKYDGLLQFFPWRFTPELAKPDVFIADYNGDGLEDIAFTFVSPTGETTSCEDLHLLLRGENGFEDHLYSGEKATVECKSHLVVNDQGDDSYIAYVDGEVSEFTLPGHASAYIGLYFNHVQDFKLGETITVELEPGLMFEKEAKPVYSVMRYTADLELRNGYLTQTNPRITME